MGMLYSKRRASSSATKHTKCTRSPCVATSLKTVAIVVDSRQCRQLHVIGIGAGAPIYRGQILLPLQRDAFSSSYDADALLEENMMLNRFFR